MVIRELQGEPNGILRVSMPPALALNVMAPLLALYKKRYPSVVLDISLDNHLVDIIKESYDLALRSAKLESSNLIAKKLCVMERTM